MISDQERLKAFDELTAELGKVATLAAQNDPSLDSILFERISQSKEGFVIMAPEARETQYGGNLRSIYHSSPQTASFKDLKIYLHFPEDEEVAVAMEQNRLGKGSYSSTPHMVTLRMGYETLRFKTCCFLHEIGHSLYSRKNGFAGTLKKVTPQQIVLDEMEMRTFDYKLMLAIGDKAFRSEVEETARKIFWWTNRRKTPYTFESKHFSMDSCFGGPALTFEDQDHRDELFRLYCMLMAVDTYSDNREHAISEKCKLVTPCVRKEFRGSV